MTSNTHPESPDARASGDFPGDLTSGFTEPVRRGLIPPAVLRGFAAGGPIRGPGTDGDDRVRIPLFTASCATPGAVFIRPLNDEEFVDLGVATADGLCVPSEQQRREDELFAETIRMAVSGETIMTTSRPWSDPASDPLSDLRAWQALTAGALGRLAAARPGMCFSADLGRDDDEDRGEQAGDDVLGQIDRATAGLCPCGGAPRPPSEQLPHGSPYCSYDCEPNYRGAHTTSDRDITPMRWRPDLVSNVDDTGLTSWLPRRQHGDFWVEVFERPGTQRLHVRVDDEHRFVGADLSRAPEDDFDQRYEAKLRTLLRELENPRHGVPAAHPGNLHEQAWAQCLRFAVDEQVRPDHLLRHLHVAIRVDPTPMRRALDDAGAALNRVIGQTADFLRRNGLIPAPPGDERAETLRRVRAARNAGPQPPPRAPKKINARRAR